MCKSENLAWLEHRLFLLSQVFKQQLRELEFLSPVMRAAGMISAIDINVSFHPANSRLQGVLYPT